MVDKPKNQHASRWAVTIDGVVIPQAEYDWTDDGNFFFPKTLLELANTYCSIHGQYDAGDSIDVCMKMEWTVVLTKDD